MIASLWCEYPPPEHTPTTTSVLSGGYQILRIEDQPITTDSGMYEIKGWLENEREIERFKVRLWEYQTLRLSVRLDITLENLEALVRMRQDAIRQRVLGEDVERPITLTISYTPKES